MEKIFKKYWHRLLILILLSASFLNFLHYALRLVFYPYEWDPYEAYHVFQSGRFVRGQPLYSSVSSYPMHVLNYTPLYFMICGLPVKLAGPCFWPVRLVSLICGLAGGGLIYLIVRRENPKAFWAVFAALFFFASPRYASYFLPMGRVDSMMLAFSLAALYCIPRAPRDFGMSAGAVFFSLSAFYTKPSAIVMLLAGWIWLLTVDRRRALILGGVFLVCASAIFLAINRPSGGEFYRHVVQLNVVRKQAGRWPEMTASFLRSYGIFFAAGTGAWLMIIGRKENCIWAYFFAGSLPYIVMTGRQGAVLNYYLPVAAAVAIVLGRQSAVLEGLIGKSRQRGLILTGWTLVFAAGFLCANLRQYVAPAASHNLLMRIYQRFFGELEGDLLISQMHSLAFTSGKKAFIFPMTLETTCGPEYRGVDQSQILGDIARKRFSYVLDNADYSFFSSQIIEKLRQHYRPWIKIAFPDWRGTEDFLLWAPQDAGLRSLGENGVYDLLNARGRTEEIADYFRYLRRQQPQNATVHYNLALALEGQGQLEEAIGSYDEAIRLKPDYLEAHLNLGGIFYKKKDLGKAIEHFRRAVSLNDRHARAHYNLGVALSERGELEEGRRHLERALQLEPGFEDARESLRKFGGK